MTAKTEAPSPRRDRSSALSYALGHRLRIEILVLLNEGPRSPSELARELREPLSKVTHHVTELVNDGSIELAEVRQQRNTLEHVYRATRPSENSQEAWSEKPMAERHVEAGLLLQRLLAEHLAAFDAGAITEDEHVGLLWRWLNVDQEGRIEIAKEQEASWKRMEEIEARSVGRRADSGEPAQSIVVSSLAHRRVRPTKWPPAFGELLDRK